MQEFLPEFQPMGGLGEAKKQQMLPVSYSGLRRSILQEARILGFRASFIHHDEFIIHQMLPFL